MYCTKGEGYSEFCSPSALIPRRLNWKTLSILTLQLHAVLLDALQYFTCVYTKYTQPNAFIKLLTGRMYTILLNYILFLLEITLQWKCDMVFFVQRIYIQWLFSFLRVRSLREIWNRSLAIMIHAIHVCIAVLMMFFFYMLLQSLNFLVVAYTDYFLVLAFWYSIFLFICMHTQ